MTITEMRKKFFEPKFKSTFKEVKKEHNKILSRVKAERISNVIDSLYLYIIYNVFHENPAKRKEFMLRLNSLFGYVFPDIIELNDIQILKKFQSFLKTIRWKPYVIWYRFDMSKPLSDKEIQVKILQHPNRILDIGSVYIPEKLHESLTEILMFRVKGDPGSKYWIKAEDIIRMLDGEIPRRLFKI